MITSFEEILSLPQKKKDALLVIAIQRLLTHHKVYPSNMNIIDRMTSDNFAHQICQTRLNIKYFDELNMSLTKQADIDLDSFDISNDFNHMLSIFDKEFPIK